jgi:hypothetical protein
MFPRAKQPFFRFLNIVSEVPEARAKSSNRETHRSEKTPSAKAKINTTLQFLDDSYFFPGITFNILRRQPIPSGSQTHIDQE